MCCGKKLKEKNVEGLGRAGQGGFGDVFIVDKNFVVKRVLQYKKDMKNPIDNQILTQTDNAEKCDAKMKEHGNNEFERLLLSQHENVIQVYATTTTDRNSLIIVLERAKHGDLKSYFKTIIDNHNLSRMRKWYWNPVNNKNNDKVKDRYRDFEYIGIVSILPWGEVNAGDRMLFVF